MSAHQPRCPDGSQCEDCHRDRPEIRYEKSLAWNINERLHHLWGKAKDGPDYRKPEWAEFSRMIDQALSLSSFIPRGSE